METKPLSYNEFIGTRWQPIVSVHHLAAALQRKNRVVSFFKIRKLRESRNTTPHGAPHTVHRTPHSTDNILAIALTGVDTTWFSHSALSVQVI